MTPIALHPENPHYFLFQGKPTVLITSAEHYGAVLNLDFDFVRYLDELHSKGLNLTRTFSGVYMEAPGDFSIAHNTLAPLENKLICPWARSSSPGYPNGGNKFDLNVWDTAYFRRLKDFLREADERGIVVEFTFFCPFYEESMWKLSPMNAANNVNGIGAVSRTEVYSMKDADLLTVQDKVVKKIVNELREVENVYYEICNEPYAGDLKPEWQAHVADLIVETEASFPHKHLISQNISNGSLKIEKPNPYVSVFSFHYAHPPTAVAENYSLNKVIAENETGFRGTEDSLYRTEAWDFILAGGGAYNNLDYSFTADHPDGTFQYPSNQPGGGSAALRSQLKVLKAFIEGFDFLKLKPSNEIIKGGVPEGATARALGEAGKAYAIYVLGGSQANLSVELPAGTYQAEWVNATTGKVEKTEDVRSKGAETTLSSPSYTGDIACRLMRR